jgi:hypothetical protein
MRRGCGVSASGLQVLFARFGFVIVGGLGLFWWRGYGEDGTRGFDDQAVGGVAGAVRDERWSVLDSEHDHAGAFLLCVLDDGVGEVVLQRSMAVSKAVSEASEKSVARSTVLKEGLAKLVEVCIVDWLLVTAWGFRCLNTRGGLVSGKWRG